MRLIGFLSGTESWIGSVEGGLVFPIMPLDHFYADPAAAITNAKSGASGLPLADVAQIPPVPRSAKVVCVGLNYASHADEAGFAVPQYPTVFGRWASTLVTDGAELPVPPEERGLDWEVELAVILGRPLFHAKEEEALDAVLGYTVFNDVSARHKQMQTSQWTLGKNSDGSGPIGPTVVTRDVISDPSNLELELRVNGVVQQSANTKDMVFSIAKILAYVTETLTLLPGDVVATGTPSGVGFTRSPEVLLVPGDVVEASISQIGVLRNTVGLHPGLQ